MKHLTTTLPIFLFALILAPACDGDELGDTGTGGEDDIAPLHSSGEPSPLVDASLNSEVHDSEWMEGNGEVSHADVVLHMSFGPELSEEEIERQWNEAKEEYRKRRASSQERRVAGITFEVTTRTGDTWDYSGTNADIEAKIFWKTDRHLERTSYTLLDNPNKNDFEPGNTDKFLVEDHSISSNDPQWISLRKATIRHQGTNGWELDYFHVFIDEIDHFRVCRAQDIPVVQIHGTQNTWLDNNTSSGWDYAYSNSTFGNVLYCN